MLILAVIVCLSHVEFSHASLILPSKTTGRRSRRTVSGLFRLFSVNWAILWQR